MPPKAKPKEEPKKKGVPVQPAVGWGVSEETMKGFIKNATVKDMSPYLDCTKDDRYVLISVDPAGGGFLSEEAFVIWLVAQDKFALFSGRSVKGHKATYTFSTVPLMFVVSLLETIQQVQQALMKLHSKSAQQMTTVFKMPEVVVLLETNYAYGAAVYMQTLFFLEDRKKKVPDLADVSIIFATPVYMWNPHTADIKDQLQTAEMRQETSKKQFTLAKEKLDEVWKNRNMKVGHKEDLLREIEKKYNFEIGQDFDKIPEAYLPVNQMVTIAIDEMIATVKDTKEGKKNNKWKTFEEYMKGEVVVGTFTQMENFRRSLQAGKQTISKLKKELADSENKGITATPGGQDLFRSKPWPQGVKMVDKEAKLDNEYVFWNAPKSFLGETTTLQEKIRAFEHWVYILKSSNPRIKILDVGSVTHPFDSKAVGCDEIPTELGEGVRGLLLHPLTILKCVYHQWCKLEVLVDPASIDQKQIVQIRGKMAKGDGEEVNAVHRDDLWMAFSIGMQWCSRFTVLLATSQLRQHLIQYMRNIRVLANRAIQQCLQDAALSEDVTSPSVAVAASPVAGYVPTIQLPPDVVIDSLVTVSAIVNAALTQCQLMRNMCRKLIMSCAVAGLAPHSGFHITTRLIMRDRHLLLQQPYWKEKVAVQLRAEGTLLTLDQVSKMFGTTSSTLRIVSAPPHSGVRNWPSNQTGQRNSTTDETMYNIGQNLTILQQFALPVLQLHASYHPILKTIVSQKLPMMMIHRLLTLQSSLQSIIAELTPEIVETCTQNSMTELSKTYYNQTRSDELSSFMSLNLLTIYVELTEELLFLRKLHMHGKKYLVKVLEYIPEKRWEVSRIVKDDGLAVPLSRCCNGAAPCS